MNDNEPAVYDIMPEADGWHTWTVYNTKTMEPALVKGVRQVGLAFADADDLADALNAMERKEPGSSVTWADGSR
ncbi:hypothetical protein [Methylobacterium sp. E-045]|uniref:hypothetical protein n=1 Tax=Methylobacterium sp. E-045 TaxID=2836575 RepID=UPI001FBA1523|nr:hypothetical protein [Methylobacterium sp. E-045]MCJ2131440.1 hypothetical protein [Methylobacterium sp. E-045]